MSIEKAIDILGYNDIKQSIKKYTASNLGAELVKQMVPKTNPKIILQEYEEVKEAVNIFSGGKGFALGGINDINPYLKKIEKQIILQPDDLIKISDFLRCARQLKKSISTYELSAPVLYSYSLGLGNFEAIENEIEFCIENGMVHSRASKNLEKLRNKIEALHQKRLERLNKFLTSSKNAKYLQENYYTQRDERYVIPIKASARKLVQGTVISSSSSGSTVFIEIDPIKNLTVEIMMYKAQEEEECYQILTTLTGMVLENISQIKDMTKVIGKYDFIFAKGKYSVDIGGNEIEIRDDEVIDLKKARHPMLGKEAVPLDITIGTDYRTIVVTGPNTGGKTIVLKTIGLIALMTQSGILPPVGSGSSISIFNKILVEIGDSQSIEQSLSTFSGHMKNLVEIVNKSSRRTLVLIDEIGTGTDPKDGAALGIAILEEIYSRGGITVVSTHYSKIKEYSEVHEGFINASMDFNKKTLQPLFKLKIGVAGQSNALWISKQLGLPEKIINRVKSINSRHDIVKVKEVKKFAKKKSRVEEITRKSEGIDEARTIYNKGDRVFLTESKKFSLVFEHKISDYTVVTFDDGEYTNIYEKRVKLDRRREELYPHGYDLDQLFISFQRRKLEKDIEKGRFKDLKELQMRIDAIEENK